MGTITKPGAFSDRSGNYSRRIFNYAGPSSYATGGDSLPPESIGLGRIEALLGLQISNGTNVYWGVYDQTTEKILWYSATGTEIANATDLSGFSGRFEAIGI
jgi:hypothetical protein